MWWTAFQFSCLWFFFSLLFAQLFSITWHCLHLPLPAANSSCAVFPQHTRKSIKMALLCQQRGRRIINKRIVKMMTIMDDDSIKNAENEEERKSAYPPPPPTRPPQTKTIILGPIRVYWQCHYWHRVSGLLLSLTRIQGIINVHIWSMDERVKSYAWSINISTQNLPVQSARCTCAYSA